MALYKREILVRHNSSYDFDGAMNWSLNWLNGLQDRDDNKDTEGNYIDYYFADVFFAPGHANGGQVWRIFSSACEQKYAMQKDPNTNRIEFKINDLVGLQAQIDENAQAFEQIAQEVESLGDTVESNTERIEALEANDTGDGVEATVI